MKRFLLVCALLVCATALLAVSFDKLRVNGFLSQGYIYSTGNDYLVPDSQHGSHEMNELGFTMQTNLTPKLRIGFQLLSRDFGDIGNNNTTIDWAFADYRWRDCLGVRFGKVKLPFGLYNESRDTDILRSMVLLPQSMYDEHYRSYFLSYQGTGLYGSIFANFLGTLDYNVYMGSMNFSSNEVIMRAVNNVSNEIFQSSLAGAEQIAKQTVASQAGLDASLLTSSSSVQTLFEETSARPNGADGIWGVSFFWSPNVDPIPFMDNMKLGASYFEANLNFLSGGASGEYSVYDPSSNLLFRDVLVMRHGKGGVPNRMGYSMEYNFRRFTLAAEYVQQELNIGFESGNGAKLSTFEEEDTFYYGMASFLLNDQLTLSAMYDCVSIDRQELVATSQTIDLLANAEDWHKERTDIGFGIRYDVTFNWALKAEYHLMTGIANIFSDTLNNQAVEPEENWNVFMIKASYNF